MRLISCPAEGIEFDAGLSVINLFACEIVTSGEVRSESGDDETGCGIEQDEVTARASLGAFKNVQENARVDGTVAAAKVFETAEAQTDIARIDPEFLHAAIDDFTYLGRTAERK